MMWHAYRLVYCLESPLHVGWRKFGNLMQTRTYITGRSWWGAATAHLTQWRGSYTYVAEGEFVRNNLIFGYFFPAEDPVAPCIPRWEHGELRYGTLAADEFERRFMSSLAATAIDYQHNTAAEGLLHEVEFITPQTRNGNVFLVGHLLVREGQRVRCTDDEVYVDGTPLLSQVLADVRIGGERRYGFGRIRLHQKPQRCSKLFRYDLGTTGTWPVLTVPATHPFPAHFRVDGLQAEGTIEPLLGREWDADTGPGRCISAALICWMPGSTAQQTVHAEIRPMGIGILV